MGRRLLNMQWGTVLKSATGTLPDYDQPPQDLGVVGGVEGKT